MPKLIKTTIVIWSRPGNEAMELVDLAEDAVHGLSYCSKQEAIEVEEPEKDPDWDETEFFDE